VIIQKYVPRDRQTDKDARRSAKQSRQRQAEPERHAVFHHKDGAGVTADQGIGALAHVDASDIERDPYAGAGDREQRNRRQRVIEIGPSRCRDQPRNDDENDDQECRDRGYFTSERHRP
jgi:hypothetical protein